MMKEDFANQVAAAEQMLRCVAMSYLRNLADSEDAVQEALLKAWNAVLQKGMPEYFQSWLTRIVVNVCLDMLRQRKRVVLTDKFVDVSAPSVENGIPDGVGKLEAIYREVVVLHYQYGYQLADMARALHVPLGTVKGRLFRARRQLKEILSNAS